MSYGNDNILNKSNAKILYWTANSCSYDKFSVIFIYNFIDVNIVITIEIEQVIIDNNSWWSKVSLPTEKLPEKKLIWLLQVFQNI